MWGSSDGIKLDPYVSMEEDDEGDDVLMYNMEGADFECYHVKAGSASSSSSSSSSSAASKVEENVAFSD